MNWSDDSVSKEFKKWESGEWGREVIFRARFFFELDRIENVHYRIHPVFYFWTAKVTFVYDLFLASHAEIIKIHSRMKMLPKGRSMLFLQK